jgi:hypothetical protein
MVSRDRDGVQYPVSYGLAVRGLGGIEGVQRVLARTEGENGVLGVESEE